MPHLPITFCWAPQRKAHNRIASNRKLQRWNTEIPEWNDTVNAFLEGFAKDGALPRPHRQPYGCVC